MVKYTLYVQLLSLKLEITGAELKFKAGKTTVKIVPNSSKTTILY